MAISAGTAGLMAAGSVLSSAFGMAAANHGAFKQYKYNSKLQKEAAALNYKYSKKSALNSPTWTRAGLEDAGYNPMLAVQNGTAGANSNWTSNSSVSAPDYSGLGVADAINNASRMQEVKNQTAQTESQIDLNDATAEEARAKASNYRAENPYISEQAEANIRQTDAQTTKLNADTELNHATIENMESRLELDRVLGFAGLDVARRGQDMSLAGVKYSSDNYLYGSIYNADSNERNNIRTNRTSRGKISGPFGISTTFGSLNRDMKDYYDFIPYTRHNYKNRYFRDY